MSLTTFLVLSVVMAIAVGLLASFLLRAWLQRSALAETVKNPEPEPEAFNPSPPTK